MTSIFGEVDDEFFESKVGLKFSMFNFDKSRLIFIGKQQPKFCILMLSEQCIYSRLMFYIA